MYLLDLMKKGYDLIKVPESIQITKDMIGTDAYYKLVKKNVDSIKKRIEHIPTQNCQDYIHKMKKKWLNDLKKIDVTLYSGEIYKLYGYEYRDYIMMYDIEKLTYIKLNDEIKTPGIYILVCNGYRPHDIVEYSELFPTGRRSNGTTFLSWGYWNYYIKKCVDVIQE
jgi:hypothetical protein